MEERDVFSKIKKIEDAESKAELQKQYKSVNDDDIEALKIQMQLRDKLKLRTGDHK